MMQKQKLIDMPYSSTSIVGDATVFTNASDLLVSMQFDDDGRTVESHLRFVRQRAFRKRSEIHCTGWHVNDAFDTVCEVLESEWVEELRTATVLEWKDHWVMRHFMLYLDGFGCLEVIAESAEITTGSTNSFGT